ncbi:hypothetical protein SAMN05421644_11137 [Allochromatium warmingii]|uniref:Uncharacterized protein n=1 Tax=Allochromatium warmingii TaxID=61595 RepID=A0A1H3E3X7_ALLWA|nr:hypothetical protein [Allochromatium warmingii]SDX73310.1 hypothetical protein SAMN05421644_11137 [Allochromatium warmingii]
MDSMSGNPNSAFKPVKPVKHRHARFDPIRLMSGFLPAFRHLETGEIRLCQLADGRIARRHLLDSLPDDWILERDASGRPAALVSEIEPGFLRGIQFWTLQNLANPRLDG